MANQGTPVQDANPQNTEVPIPAPALGRRRRQDADGGPGGHVESAEDATGSAGRGGGGSTPGVPAGEGATDGGGGERERVPGGEEARSEAYGQEVGPSEGVPGARKWPQDGVGPPEDGGGGDALDPPPQNKSPTGAAASSISLRKEVGLYDQYQEIDKDPQLHDYETNPQPITQKDNGAGPKLGHRHVAIQGGNKGARKGGAGSGNGGAIAAKLPRKLRSGMRQTDGQPRRRMPVRNRKGGSASEPASAQFHQDQQVLAKDGDIHYYEAKITNVKQIKESWMYKVHYLGWSNAHNKWISGDDIKKIENGKSLAPLETRDSRTSTPSDYADRSSVGGSRRNPKLEWTPVNECILLLSALDFPRELIDTGAGSWLVKKSDYEIEGRIPSSKEIRLHWEDMVRRECRQLAGCSALNYAVHVLGAAFAHESPAAKSVVLLTAGWHRVPSASKGDDKIESSRWHRASIANTLAFRNMSQSNLISKGVSLEEAWEGHLVEIREGIEEAWIPRATPEECETLEIDLPADDRAAPLGSSKEQKTQTMEKRNTRKQSAAPKARGRRKRSKDNDAVKVHNGLIENKSNEKKRINTKRSRPRSDHDGTKEEVDDDIIEVISERKSDGKKRKVETVAPSIIVSPLPDLCQLEARDGGLASALRADKLLFWNAHYGTNSNIALYALRSLATG